MDFKTTVPFTSATTPGIVGVVRKITWGARNALRKQLALVHERKLDLIADRNELIEEMAAAHGKGDDSSKLLVADLSPRELARWQKIASAIEVCDDEINAAHLEESFVSLAATSEDGKPDLVTIEGQPVTKANLAKLPPELGQELVQAVLRSSELDGDTAKNSQSPSISGGVEGSATNGSTAASVSATDTTERASVESILTS